GMDHAFMKHAARTIAGALALCLWWAPASGQERKPLADKPWLDQSLLAAAKAEGSVVVYSSTNEQEGLPLFKIFEDATGIKVQYVRGTAPSRMPGLAVESRPGRGAGDILQPPPPNKAPPQMLAHFDPAEAAHILPSARDAGRRWYGLYANYNSPAYNTN